MSSFYGNAATLRTRGWTLQLSGYLLLLPALSFLLLFTHYPAVATLWQSLFCAARASHPAHFIGLDNYRALLDADIVMQ